jgi:type III restriction enzyme
MATIPKLIINSAYSEPQAHWKYDLLTKGFDRAPGRRPAGYIVAGQGPDAYGDEGSFVPLPLVGEIRRRVAEWRNAGFPGATGATKRLLEHWRDGEARRHRFFWCQLDAMETLIWLLEAHDAARAGLHIPNDGGGFRRLCTKLCTGGGKTIVMAMLIAWQVCNKVAYPRDNRFSKHVFVVAPGLTVRSRLQVLKPGTDGNYYSMFGIVPAGMADMLHKGKIAIANWQALAWDTEEAIAKKKGVDKRGAKSDEAYARSVLGEMASARSILVINDEAHHAWRKNPEIKEKLTREQREGEREATVWIGGLDRIHRARGIRACYDFSATPYAPSGKRNDEEAVFGWIVSDFGLNDGIESGLVKTPKMVVRDDALLDPKTNRSTLSHIYIQDGVREDIKNAEAPEKPLPQLIRNGYYLLGLDWLDTFNAWQSAGAPTPPVMITVANRTETAARIKHAFGHRTSPFGKIKELCDPELTLHIDSRAMEAEAPDAAPGGRGGDSPNEGNEGNDGDGGDGGDGGPGGKKLSKKDADAIMRGKADTVGQRGKPGEKIRNVISVGMLSEGWDAKTVTHIMGLRAFSSQLLVEQVVGRGLRRTSYDLDPGSELFSPEYVNIFGIPFKFLPHESEGGDDGPTPERPKTRIEALPERAEFQICWPNIDRLERKWRPVLSADLAKMDPLPVDMARIDPLVLDADTTIKVAELAPLLDGKLDCSRLSEINLEKLDGGLRLQHIVFEAAKETFQLLQAKLKMQGEGAQYALFGQAVRLVEEFLTGGRLHIHPPLFSTSPLRRRIVWMLNMSHIVRHVWEHIEMGQTESVEPVFNRPRPMLGTGDMPTWYTARPCQVTRKSHISHCTFDSSWEATEQGALERNEHVAAWAKNDHLGFEIAYTFDGVSRRYRPDFLVRLDNGATLVLEAKGKEGREEIHKRRALAEWADAVNGLGEHGTWLCDVSRNVSDVDGIIERARSQAHANSSYTNPN